MKIAISAGHNVYVNNYFDPGATSNPHIEADINKETVAILIPYLIRQGHEVLDVTPYNQKFSNSKAHHEARCKLVDEFVADLYVDVHINAGGGTGVEAWCHNINSKSVPYATKIINNISKDMGLPSRGVKFNKSYWSLYLTKRPAVIVEGAFIDNKDDMKRLTPHKYAMAIVKAFGDVIEEPKPTQNNSLYRVQVGAYSVRENADKLLADLKKAGFNGFISETIQNSKEVETVKAKSIYTEVRRFNSDVHIFELDSKKYKVDAELGQRKKLEKVTTIVYDKLKEGKKVVGAINAGFFEFDGSVEHYGMFIDDGLYYTNPSSDFVDFIYFKDGHTEIHNHHGYDAKLLAGYQKNAHWAIGTSYSLIQNGKINLQNTDKFSHSTTYQPRTMLGQRSDGTFLLVVVDGGSVKSKGITANQQAEIMKELGAYNAVNLDGGGSSTMVLVKDGKSKVVNSPSRLVERAVGSALLVYEI